MNRQPRNLLIPFRRDKKRDFASGTGEQLLASKVRQALLTEGDTPKSSGELPWRTSFGSFLGLLRHGRNDAAMRELARVYVTDALRRWVPGARLIALRIDQIDSKLALALRVEQGAVQTDVLVPLETT